MTFKVEKGIPLIHHRAPNGSYPFGTMEIGDSFFVPNVVIETISSATRNFRQYKFTCRTLTENGIKGVRCWRIA